MQKISETFLLTFYRFPSSALFEKWFSWIHGSGDGAIHVGRKIGELIPSPFIYKLKNIYREFLWEFNRITTRISIEELSLRVVRVDDLIELKELFKDTRKKLEKLRDEILKFIDGNLVDPEFMRAYKVPGENRVDKVKLMRDYNNFKKKLAIIAEEIDPQHKVEVMNYLEERIRAKVNELPKRFVTFIGVLSFDLNVMLANLSKNVRDRIMSENYEDLENMLEESKKSILEIYRRTLEDRIEKVIEVLSYASPKLKSIIIASLSEFKDIPFIREKINEIRSLDNPSFKELYDILSGIKSWIESNFEEIVSEAVEERRDELKEGLENFISKIRSFGNKIPKNIREEIIKLKNIAKLAQEEEIADICERLLNFERIEKEALNNIEDPELKRLLSFI